jgi:hypothetical protein
LTIVNKVVEINILLSDVVHDNHVKATWKPLDCVKFRGMSFCRAKSMNVLAILMSEFDAQLLVIRSAKEDEVVFGFQL